MGKGPEQTLLQGGQSEGPEIYERMLCITSHQRDANENQNEIPLHTGESGIINKSTNYKCWRGCGEKGTLIILSINFMEGGIQESN